MPVWERKRKEEKSEEEGSPEIPEAAIARAVEVARLNLSPQEILKRVSENNLLRLNAAVVREIVDDIQFVIDEVENMIKDEEDLRLADSEKRVLSAILLVAVKKNGISMEV